MPSHESADISGLLLFLVARFDEEEQQAELFHELHCPATPTAGTAICRCPCRNALVERVCRLRALAQDNGRTLEIGDARHRRWPLNVAFAVTALRALALPYELHPQWEERWRP